MSDDDRLRALEARVAALEQRLAGEPAQPAQPAALGIGSPLLNELRSRSDAIYQGEPISGAVRYAGVVQFAGGELLWEIERAAPWIATLDPQTLAPVFAALGSPPRLLLVRAMLLEPRTSQQLQEVLGVASPGQLYHHLKELLAAGIIEQRGRNNYRLSQQKVIPLLVALALAFELGSG